MSKQQLFSFMVSAFCFLCMIFNGFIMDVSMVKIFIQLLLITTSLVNLYLGLKGFVSESVETTQNQEVG